MMTLSKKWRDLGYYFDISVKYHIHAKVPFFKLGFTPCKAEQPLRGMELQEKEAQKRL